MDASLYPLTLYYDSHCPMCRAEMHNLMQRNAAGRLRFADIHGEGFAPPEGYTREQLLARFHAQLANGAVVHSLEAFRLSYQAVGLGWVTGFTRWPLIGHLLNRVYPVFAQHRHRVPRWFSHAIFTRAARRAQRRRCDAADSCRLPQPCPRPHPPIPPNLEQVPAMPAQQPVPHARLCILLTGASGFIGRHIRAALTAAGHEVIGAVSARHRNDPMRDMVVDFARDTSPDKWHERFWLHRHRGFDVVINAVGVLRDTRARPIEAVHRDTPIALFDACTQTNIQGGIPRVLQISALGVQDGTTRYASTKRAADEHLLQLAANGQTYYGKFGGDKHSGGPFHAAVLRPSVVFGAGGASSQLFMTLAKLALLCLPQPVLTAQVQPVAVTDLAAAVVAWVQAQEPPDGILPLVGPEPVRLGDFIASLRQQLGRTPAKVMRLPDVLTHLSARVGDWVPVSPWCSESLALLGKDNTGDASILRGLLGRDAVPYRDLVDAVWRRP